VVNSGLNGESDERLQVLETKADFQDRTIEALDDIIRRQQDQIEYLQEELRKLSDAFFASNPEGIAGDEEPPPPHY